MSFPFKLRYPALSIAFAILFVDGALAQSTVAVPVSGYELKRVPEDGCNSRALAKAHGRSGSTTPDSPCSTAR